MSNKGEINKQNASRIYRIRHPSSRRRNYSNEKLRIEGKSKCML